jgi:hypothetical protein
MLLPQPSPKPSNFQPLLGKNMSFVLEPINTEAIERMVSDAPHGSTLKKDLLSLRGLRSTVWGNWSVDKDRQIYLVCKPHVTPKENAESIYLFLFEGTLLQLKMRSLFGSDISFLDAPSPERLEEVKRVLTEAFSAFNFTGPDLATPFTPKFVEGF